MLMTSDAVFVYMTIIVQTEQTDKLRDIETKKEEMTNNPMNPNQNLQDHTMERYYEVCFKCSSEVYISQIQHLSGAMVIVQCERGSNIGFVLREVTLEEFTIIQSANPTSKPKNVLSELPDKDQSIRQVLVSKIAAENYALYQCELQMQGRRLGSTAEVLSTEFQFDRKKLTIYMKKYEDASVCRLVRQLYEIFKMRVKVLEVDHLDILKERARIYLEISTLGTEFNELFPNRNVVYPASHAEPFLQRHRSGNDSNSPPPGQGQGQSPSTSPRNQVNREQQKYFTFTGTSPGVSPSTSPRNVEHQQFFPAPSDARTPLIRPRTQPDSSLHQYRQQQIMHYYSPFSHSDQPTPPQLQSLRSNPHHTLDHFHNSNDYDLPNASYDQRLRHLHHDHETPATRYDPPHFYPPASYSTGSHGQSLPIAPPHPSRDYRSHATMSHYRTDRPHSHPPPPLSVSSHSILSDLASARPDTTRYSMNTTTDHSYSHDPNPPHYVYDYAIRNSGRGRVRDPSLAISSLTSTSAPSSNSRYSISTDYQVQQRPLNQSDFYHHDVNSNSDPNTDYYFHK